MITLSISTWEAIILAVSFIIVGIVGTCIGIHYEKKRFNGGKCPHCGKDLRLFDHDSQGGRGYTCDVCGHKAWVSYFTVDRKYLNAIFK